MLRNGRLATGLPDASFDAVVIVFGIFFVPDMEVTTWGPRVFVPLDAKFRASIVAHAPALANRFNPWDRISTPEALKALLAAAGGTAIEGHAEAGSQELGSSAGRWTIINGTGYRLSLVARENPLGLTMHRRCTSVDASRR